MDRIFSLMVPPVVLTLLMIVINIPLRLYASRFAFTETELVIFFAMQQIMCAMASEWMDVINPYIHSYGLYAAQTERYRTKILVVRCATTRTRWAFSVRCKRWRVRNTAYLLAAAGGRSIIPLVMRRVS